MRGPTSSPFIPLADETGKLKSQAEVEHALTGGQLLLFDDPALNPKTGLSRKKYQREGEES